MPSKSRVAAASSAAWAAPLRFFIGAAAGAVAAKTAHGNGIHPVFTIPKV
jgi:hypothetical protein